MAINQNHDVACMMQQNINGSKERFAECIQKYRLVEIFNLTSKEKPILDYSSLQIERYSESHES